MTNTRTAAPDHLDAIHDVAKAYGYTEVHDSGPCLDGKLVIFGDQEFADDYLNGTGTLGKAVYVRCNRRGELASAELRVDAAHLEVVRQDSGTAGERLVWIAKIFMEYPAVDR